MGGGEHFQSFRHIFQQKAGQAVPELLLLSCPLVYCILLTMGFLKLDYPTLPVLQMEHIPELGIALVGLGFILCIQQEFLSWLKIGPSVRYINQEKVNMKPPQSSSSLIRWHQDWAFFPYTNDSLVTVCIAVDDSTKENGKPLSRTIKFYSERTVECFGKGL